MDDCVVGLGGRLQGECKICLDGDESGRVLAALTPCGHMLCTECCDHLLSRRHACPICRERVLGVQRLFLP